MSRAHKALLRGLLGLGLLLGVVVLADLSQLWQRLRQAQPLWLLAGLALALASNIVSALRWRALVQWLRRLLVQEQVDLVHGFTITCAVYGSLAARLAARTPHPAIAAHPRLPGDTRLWAALQDASGGTWGGCVYDVDTILETLRAGREALAARERSA